MKRRILNKSFLKQTALAVPAAALMLGAAQAGTTIGLNFNSYYYNTAGQNWSTYGGTPGPAGFGWGYQTSGWPVTAKAFGVDAAKWHSGSIFAWWTPTPVDVNVPMGSVGAQCTAPAAIETGIGEQVAGWLPETVAPGNDEVTWNILQSNGGVSPAVVVTNLAATYPNGYVVETITATRGTSAQFNGVGFTDTIKTTHADYNTTYYRQNPASDGAVTGGTVGVSDPSGILTGDTLTINCDAETSPSNSVLCGFIITDQPVVTHSSPASTLVGVGGSFVLSANVLGISTLSYQWRHAGTNIPGATSVNYTKSPATAADSGNYQLIATGSLFPSSPATGDVVVVTVIPPHAARTATWDANTGTTGAQDGSGTWSYSLVNWWSGSADDYWGAPDSAIFGVGGSGPYTVTLADNITANGITFNSGGYTITNSSGQSLTLDTNTTVTANAAATIGAPLSTGTNTFFKPGTGALTVSGALNSARTVVQAGTLEVLAHVGDSPYVVTNGTTLKIGYSTGGGYANTSLQLYGDGTAATTGLYLKGGTKYNVSGSLIVNNAPTTIRQYGSGLASLSIFDINSNPGLSITAAASGSVIDSNIQMVQGGYGMVVTTAAGANTTTGDLLLNGPLNVGTLGLYKRGGGSLRLNGAALAGNLALRVENGAVICGANNCIGANASLITSAGTSLDLNGFSQTVTNATLAGTLKMTINTGGTPSGDVLTVLDGMALSYGGDLVVKSIGTAPTIGQKFTLFSAAGGYGGAFTSVSLPAFDHLAWDTTGLFVDGSITVIAGSVAPTITTDLPATCYAYVGGSVSLSVVATGDPILHYLWKKNGTTPVGTDSPTLTLSSVTAANAGSYSVTVSNPYPPTAQSVSCVVSVVTPSAVASASLTDSPLAFWPLSETAGSTAFDYWAGHNGANAGTLPSSVAGPRPPAYQGFSSGTTAYNFDGASYVDCGTAPALSGTTDFTLEVWINTTNTLGSYVLQQRSGYNGEYMLRLNGSGTVAFTIYGGGGYQCDFSSPRAARRVNDGAWHHIAVVRSGTSVVIYIDGSAVATATGTLAPLDPTFTVGIGKDFRDNTAYFIGGICDVAIYSHALSAARIGSHASTGWLNTSPLKLNLVAGGWVEDTKPVGQPNDGMNLGASWVASSTDAAGTPVTRTGVAQFLPSGAQIAVPANADVNSSVGTICFWMRTPLPVAGTGVMLVDRRTSAGLVLVLDGTPSGGFGVQYTGNASFATGGNVVDDNWHQVTLTYDQSATGSVTVYVDGANVGGQVNTAAWSWPTTQQMELGRSHDTYWQEYNGQMDDFRIYNRILTDTEIATIAAPATSDDLVDTAALKVRYNFGTAAGVGSQLSWQIGVLQGAPALGSPTIWTPINRTTPSYPFLPPYPVTNAAAFYELKLN